MEEFIGWNIKNVSIRYYVIWQVGPNEEPPFAVLRQRHIAQLKPPHLDTVFVLASWAYLHSPASNHADTPVARLLIALKSKAGTFGIYMAQSACYKRRFSCTESISYTLPNMASWIRVHEHSLKYFF